ncbi:MAG: SDR family oxidoreductase [Burkholderiaceae bacterium]
MDIKGRIAVVTGAASGIGRATALKFAAEGAAGVVVADLNETELDKVAAQTGGLAVRCDVGREDEIQRLVDAAHQRYGRIDVFFSNAGILGGGGPEAPDELWDAMWRIHLMAHVWAARAVVEPMIAAGGGQFIITASAAGLLNIIESAPYGVTKHAAVAFAEWLSIAYGRRGLDVACLCPQAVRTGMVPGDGGSAGGDGILSAEQVAEDVLEAMRESRFLVLPHPQVLDYMRAKTRDYDRWLGGMQKMFMKANPQ